MKLQVGGKSWTSYIKAHRKVSELLYMDPRYIYTLFGIFIVAFSVATKNQRAVLYGLGYKDLASFIFCLVSSVLNLKNFLLL